VLFWVEVSDNVNVLKGENSLMGELKILVGVMTAAVGNILHYWFKLKKVSAISRSIYA
jgi:hypothetical protein